MSSSHVSVWIAAGLSLTAGLALGTDQAKPGPGPGDHTFQFDAVSMHEPLEHIFTFENTGPEILRLAKVTLTPPLECPKATSKVAPGESGSVTIRLGEPRTKGEYHGQVELAFKNPGVSNLVYQFVGKIAPAIECVPMPAFFVSTRRGQPKQGMIQLVNREKEPLQILRVEHSSSRFTTELETVEPGQRYALRLNLKADGKPGRQSEPITVATSSKKEPLLKIEANTLIKERVYAFPDTLDFGVIRIQDLKSQPRVEEWLAQNLMVYQDGGKDFNVTARTDIPFLKLAAERSKLNDRCQIKVEIIPEKLTPGQITKTIAIETNDPEFSRLEVPVKIVVE